MLFKILILVQIFTGPVVSGFSYLPQGLTVNANCHDAVLKWQPSPTQGVTGYKVYRGTVSGGPYTKVAPVNAAPYTDLSITRGQTYYYVVRAEKGSQESANSNEAKAVIP